jgi:biopolymer transport protein ExbD
MAVLALMENGAEEIAKAVIGSAKGGDLAAARLVLERLAPPMRERPISIDLPDTTTAKGIEKASQAVLDAAASGELLLGEAQVLSGIIEFRRKALETQEFEQRLAALEAKNVAA